MTQSDDPRVADYLDDKLQTLADLESLDSLLLAVRDQQSKLRQQLQDAHQDLKEAKEASAKHVNLLETKVKEFDNDQLDIDRRLREVTQSDTSDDAVQRFEVSITKLNKLTVAKEYVRLLGEVDAISDECLSNLGTSDSASLNAYEQMRVLLTQLETLQSAADGAAPHLIDHARSKSKYMGEQMEKVFAGQLQKVLKRIAWPNPDTTVPETLQAEFSTAVEKLLDLQRPDLVEHEKLNDGSRTVQPLVLLPLKILIQPLELGFRYHFEGDRPTNRLERPEFFLSHVTERILSKYIDFMELFIQPILLRKFRSTELALNYSYIDASSALITAILPMLRIKIFSILPQIIQQPPLLSHLIHEVTKFDTEIRVEWHYDGGSRGEIWKGLAFEVLSTDHVFQKWLASEKNFALSRYEDIVEEPDSFELDFDSLGPGKTKPSKAAIRVNDLLEATTDNYRELVSFSQKLRFLIDIQISIFDLFHRRLADALGAYIARTSAIVGNREDRAQLQGVSGLERLCRIFGSADYLERAMRDWNDDVFFLELWSELQHRASQSSAQDTFAGTLTVADVAARTSSTINSQPGTPAEENTMEFEEGALFDETAASYARIRSKAEGLMSDLLSNNIRQSLSAYIKVNAWSSLAHTSQATEQQLSTSAELDTMLQNLRTMLSYLSKAVGTVPVRRLTKPMLQNIENTIVNQVILTHTFSQSGASQLKSDVAAVSNVISKYLDKAVVNLSFERLSQATRLLNIPVQGRHHDEDKVVGHSDENGADEGIVGLIEAGKRLFEGSGEDAKQLLEQLGLDRLSIGEARKILSHRVELGS